MLWHLMLIRLTPIIIKKKKKKGIEPAAFGLLVHCSRDGAVHKIFVRKLHRTTEFHPHTALHCKKFVNLFHCTANTIASQNVTVTVWLNTNTVFYCMQNYKPNRLAPHGPPDGSHTIALNNDLVKIVA